MKTTLKATMLAATALGALIPTSNLAAHDGPHAADHAPIGVMADHRHQKGEWMVSYRFMQMIMDGNRDGTSSLSPEEIATTVDNPFAGLPMQPPTLRVVPTEMTMTMHMVGAMYGVTDRITLAAMGNYLTNDMDHITFEGGMGTNRLGTFTTETAGFGDTKVVAIVGLDDSARAEMQLNANIGLSLPTGSLEETDQILTPMGATPSPRLPYPMQLGSGTFDLEPALTYRDRTGKISWGTQAKAVIRTGENDEGYTLGDCAEFTGWMGYSPAPWSTGFLRLKAVSQGRIDGADPLIVAPVQTADPRNHGGETVEVFAGVNLAGQSGIWKGHRVAAEVGFPLHRDLNGPQLETDLTFTLGWQKAF